MRLRAATRTWWHALPGLALAAALLGAAAASHAYVPVPVAVSERTDQTAREHRVHILVSGPPDTLMHVRRGAAQSHVALRGKPFEYTFTAPRGGRGYHSIVVSAASANPRGRQVTCEIRVDGVVVAKQATAERDESGYAQVQCAVPRPA